MFLTEIAEPTLLVIYPGRFQPWHKGHHAVYNWLTGKFGRNNVYIATSNKTDNLKSPFSFSEKAYFMQLTGVPADRIVQATSPYQIDSVLASGQVTVQNPDNTVVIFAVSEKDMAEDPRFSFAPKKDGTESFFQQLKDIKDTKSMKQHGYIMTVPTFDFAVLGKPATSASEIRAQYKVADEKTRQAIVKDLFGRYTAEAEQIMNSKLAPAPAPTGTQPVAEDAAGVGVVKGGQDPRYVMATTGDQNDVNASTPKKNLKAFNLAEEDIEETIRKLGSQYRLYSGKGKNLGTFPTRAGAEKHEREVQYFKHANEGVAGKVEPIQELSSDALDRYKAKAKKSADDLTSQGKYRQANDRTMNVMKATGKQIDKTATNIRKALNRESVGRDMAEGKWNYPPEYTKKANADDEDELKVSLINKDARKAWRKKQKAKAHKDLITGKNKEKGVAEGAIDNLEARRIEDLNRLMDEILVRFRTEKLPAYYRDALKQRLDQLKAERDSYYHVRA